MGGTVREQVARALRLRQGGASYAEIASAVGCSRNTVSCLLGFARLDPLDLADFLAGRLSLSQAERLIRTAPRLLRGWSSGGEGVLVREREELAAEVARLRVQVEEIKRFLEVVKKMAGLVSVDLLKPHPKNGEYFDDPTPEEYEQIKRSIAENGIRDPLKVLPDYTVVAGCLRLRVAKELGLSHVPVEIWDVSGDEAEYLLVADNEERRACMDPVKKARRAEFLKRYWGIRRGGTGANQHAGKNSEVLKEKNSPLRRLDDVARAVGEEVGNLKKLLKLNDLIPPLQDLVSCGKLSQTAAYSLAFLPHEEQERLLAALGESGLGELSVQEAQELRRELDVERKRAVDVEARVEELERLLAQAQRGSREVESLRAELVQLKEENERLKSRGPEVVEKVVERVVVRPDPKQEVEVRRLRVEVEKLQARLAGVGKEPSGAGELRDLERQLEEKRRELQQMQAEIGVLDDWLKSRRATQGLLAMLRKLFTPLEKAREEVGERFRTTEFGPLHHLEIQEWIALLEWYLRRLRDLLNVRSAQVIDISEYRGGSRDERQLPGSC